MKQTTTKTLLPQLQSRWLNIHPEAAATTANMLEDVIHSIFGDASRISYELLQNADDASKSDGLSVDVEYLLLDKHLVVQHNGRHFSASDVEAICRYGALGENLDANKDSKQYDLKKIGYKGIGFKSVFNLADRVWVCSDPFAFKFDKLFWEKKKKRLPWQIVPIPFKLGELPEQVRTFLKPGWVSFVLELKSNDRERVKKPIATLFNKEEVILFLRHVRSIKMFVHRSNDNEIVPYRELVREKEGTIFKLEKWVKGELQTESGWHVSGFFFPVPPEISDSLKPLDKRQCPEKLKSATETEIRFGAKLGKDNSIIPLTIPNLFSFLPTRTPHRFPFLVNGNFLMNEARTNLLDVPWNEFLFEKIGYLQLQWFEQMAADDRFKYEFAGLLVKYADSNKEKRIQRLNKGIIQASREIAFVPVLESDELRKAHETIVDQTGAGTDLGDSNLVKESFAEDLAIADPSIKQINNLIRIGAEQFDREKLRDAIRQTNRYRNPDDNIRLINFFFKRITGLEDEGDRDAWKLILHKTPFLLDQEEALACPNELYFPSDVPKLPFELDIRFLHAVVYRKHINRNEKLEAWLNLLGLAYPDPGEIIRRGVFSLLDEDKISPPIIVPVTRYLFQNHLYLTEKDFLLLGRLPVLTTNGTILKAYLAYLSDAYEPNLPLEPLLDEDIFISPDYMEEGDEPMVWNRFWSKLGVRQDMVIELNETRSPFARLKDQYPEYHAFLKPLLPDFSKTARHDLVNFVIPRYIQYCERYDFARQYWTIVLKEKWKEVKRKCSRCIFQHSNGRSPVPSYFEFIVRSKPYFPARDGRCYPTEALFSQNVADLIGEMYPVSALPMTKEQEDFWGIRNELDLKTCLELLQAIADGDTPIDKRVIANLYKYILGCRFNPEEFKAQRSRISNLKLLAANNTFRPISGLFYLAVPEFVLKADLANVVFLDLPEEKALQLCRGLGIAIMDIENLSLSVEPATTTDVLKTTWTNRIPVISAWVAYKTGRNISTEQQRLAELTENMIIQSAEQIVLEFEPEGKELFRKFVRAWMDGHTLYVSHPWQDTQTQFELISLLGQYFGLEAFERELELLLTLSLEEGINWLQENGIEMEATEIEKIIVQPKPSKKKKKSSPVMVPVKEAGAARLNVVRSPGRSYQPIKQKAAREIGNWGEQYVFEKKEIIQYYKNHQISIKELHWANQGGESDLPYDFVVVLENGDEEYWEVKSTPSPDKNQFPISDRQLQFALQKREKYYLLRLQNAGQKNPEIKIFPNVAAFIEAGDILISGAELRIVQK